MCSKVASWTSSQIYGSVFWRNRKWHQRASHLSPMDRVNTRLPSPAKTTQLSTYNYYGRLLPMQMRTSVEHVVAFGWLVKMLLEQCSYVFHLWAAAEPWPSFPRHTGSSVHLGLPLSMPSSHFCWEQDIHVHALLSLQLMYINEEIQALQQGRVPLEASKSSADMHRTRFSQWGRREEPLNSGWKEF